VAKKKKKPISKKERAPTFSDSPWARVSQEVNQTWEQRKEFIGKIERTLRGKVIVYFTSFHDESALITDSDAEMIENILSAEHQRGDKILLVLNSAGGIGLAAERIVNVCRAYSDNQFEVIVPHMAKSAATLICFGASRIHMSSTAELGPVDPQVKYKSETGENVWIAADEYVKSYQQLMEKATSGGVERIEPFLQQLQRYDARYIEQLLSAQELSESISIKLLKTGMMSNLTEKKIKEKISAFLVHKETKSHGRMITMDEAKRYGLKIKEIMLRSVLWNLIWELFIRADWVVTQRARKIIESNTSSIIVPLEPRS